LRFFLDGAPYSEEDEAGSGTTEAYTVEDGFAEAEERAGFLRLFDFLEAE